jgi:ATP/maltotriose-dependent transcriptional regulator MalT
MAFATPYIENGILIYCIGTQWYTLSIESQDWQAWLNERGRIFRFGDKLLKYTARLEKRENKHYWYAYCNYRKKVHKIYLGRSEVLTSIRLRNAAAELYKRCNSEKTFTSAEVASEIFQSHQRERTSQTDEEPMLDTDAKRKGEHVYMDVETMYPFPSTTNNNDSLLFAPLEEPLTNREREMLQYLVAGFSNKEIARQLVLSPGTIKWHLKNLYNKLHVHTRSQAIARARALNL